MRPVTDFASDAMRINYDVISLLQNTFILRRPRVVNFDEVVKIVIMLIKATFKTQKKSAELEIMN